jgi:hypothetical protein
LVCRRWPRAAERTVSRGRWRSADPAG